MQPIVGAVLVGVMLLSAGAGGGFLLATSTPPPAPLLCTIDPIMADELAHNTALLAQIASTLAQWEARQQSGIQEAERRRQRLQRDAPRPGQTTGLGELPTALEQK